MEHDSKVYPDTEPPSPTESASLLQVTVWGNDLRPAATNILNVGPSWMHQVVTLAGSTLPFYEALVHPRGWDIVRTR